MIIIENYINADRVKTMSLEKIEKIFDNNQINFLTVARLVEQKAIDRFIRVHKKMNDLNFKSKVYIIGDGPLKQQLVNQVQKSGIEKSFIFLGKKENPYPYIKQADCFCLLSYFEGYGMVIDEAKILEKPIIITDTAAREALQDYENCFIVNNTEEAILESLINYVQNNGKYLLKSEYIGNNRNILTKIRELLNWNLNYIIILWQYTIMWYNATWNQTIVKQFYK